MMLQQIAFQLLHNTGTIKLKINLSPTMNTNSLEIYERKDQNLTDEIQNVKFWPSTY